MAVSMSSSCSSMPVQEPVDAASLTQGFQQLAQALSQLNTVLQARAAASAPTTVAQAASGQASLDPATGGVASGGGTGGCGCGGMAGAATGQDRLGDANALGDRGVHQRGVDVYQSDPGIVQRGPDRPGRRGRRRHRGLQGAPRNSPPKGDAAGGNAAGNIAVPGTAVSGPEQHTKQENALVVADVAQKLGVDPVLAVATMLVESNGDNTEKSGDGGTSFGLFQLHVNGELPADWNPGKPGHVNAFDPRKNAEIALRVFALNKNRYSGSELAFRSQRPADHDRYVSNVESRMDEARQLLGA